MTNSRWLMTLLSLATLGSAHKTAWAEQPGLYCPPATGNWKTVKPAEAGWDAAKLKAAIAYAGRNRSTGVVILHRGRLLAEKHWEAKRGATAKFRRRSPGKTKAGHAIEDVASAQKSVAAVLVGIARQKKLLKLDDRVDKYLGTGWTKAAADQEKAITIRHLITMTTGLSDAGRFEAKAGTKWRYNTWAYAKSMDVVSKAAGVDRNKLTAKWLTRPVGMGNSKWSRRRAAGVQAVNAWGFTTTARDLARFGLLMLADGTWDKTAILTDRKFLKQATTSSQRHNPFYGYLWWVNRNSFAKNGRVKRIATAPLDMFSANGALNRRCFVVPSLQLVVTRIGDRPPDGRRFDRVLWKLLLDAAPRTGK